MRNEYFLSESSFFIGGFNCFIFYILGFQFYRCFRMFFGVSLEFNLCFGFNKK